MKENKKNDALLTERRALCYIDKEVYKKVKILAVKEEIPAHALLTRAVDYYVSLQLKKG